jgi:hypothetical protein
VVVVVVVVVVVGVVVIVVVVSGTVVLVVVVVSGTVTGTVVVVVQLGSRGYSSHFQAPAFGTTMTKLPRISNRAIIFLFIIALLTTLPLRLCVYGPLLYRTFVQ